MPQPKPNHPACKLTVHTNKLFRPSVQPDCAHQPEERSASHFYQASTRVLIVLQAQPLSLPLEAVPRRCVWRENEVEA
jgi:hypothetical protein